MLLIPIAIDDYVHDEGDEAWGVGVCVAKRRKAG